MTYRTLIRRSLRFHARAHFGATLGAVIGSASLIGALVVGDSVRGTLKDRALARLGGIRYAISTQDRLFKVHSERAGVSGLLNSSPSFSAPAAVIGSGTNTSALLLPGVATRQDGSGRANQVSVIGVETPSWFTVAGWDKLSPRFWARGRNGEKVHAEEVASQGAWTRDNEGRRIYKDEVTRMRPGDGSDPLGPWSAGETAFINGTLAQQLSVKPGDEIVVRVRKPTALGLDAAISPRDESAVALRLRVGAILTPELLGDFSLAAGQIPPANLFLPKDVLGLKVGAPGLANLVLEGSIEEIPRANLWATQRRELASWARKHSKPPVPVQVPGPGLHSTSYIISRANTNSFWERLARIIEPERLYVPVPDSRALPWLEAQLERVWVPEDVGLTVRAIEQPQTVTGGEYIRPAAEIGSSRIFLEPAVVTAALTPRSRLLTNHPAIASDTLSDLAFSPFVTNGYGVLTYLANLIKAGDRSTPYSMVTALGGHLLPADMRDDEILINEWLADDLQAKTGDSLQLSYYVVDSGSHLIERTNSFRVRAVVPIRGVFADRTLMPEFPGIAKAESTHDWDTGFPMSYTIRDKDEAYWRQYRGTPKAFVTPAAGQAMWANRFGNLTAIRYEVPTNSFASSYRDAAYRNLLANLNPADFGLQFQPVRTQALQAAAQSQDFGQLFLGFSFFLVLSALLLMALLFQFGLEQRLAEVGTLLALGFTARQVRRLLLSEGAGLAFAGGILGAAGGLGYAKAMLWALTTVWRDAVGASSLQFHASATTLLIGISASTLVAVFTLWLTLRKQARQPARELLAGETARSMRIRGGSRGKWVAAASGCGALLFLGWAMAQGGSANAEAFFCVGALLLITGVALAATWLGNLAQLTQTEAFTISGLGVRSCARRRKRSVATIALLACGCFLIAAIGVFRLDANLDATQRYSGTGGFALLGQSTLPVVQDLNTQAGREFFGLGAKDLAGVNVVQFRVRDGEDASCLNLHRAHKPRLLGVNPELLAGRFTFSQAAKGSDRRRGWNLLTAQDDRKLESNGSPVPTAPMDEVPAIGDANSIQWALGKSVGDTIDYTDEQGRAFKVRLVGAVANSILQGSLIIDEAEFVKRFPSESGYRMFLIDTPTNAISEVSTTLSRAMQDAGMELTPAAQRLNAFNAVQNTYLGTFQILGGLGLLLGSAGLGIVVLRNVLERRGELAVLLAVGFRQRALHRLVLWEHGALLGIGLGLGLATAAVAVLPAILAPGRTLPLASLTITLAAVLLNGAIWTWVATRYALRGNLLDALRNE
jgi:putative ABC transport system permease protein